MQAERTFSVTREVTIHASPETVFAFFTDPARMVQWMGTKAMLDPRPGGVFRVNPGGHAVSEGRAPVTLLGPQKLSGLGCRRSFRLKR